jgi:uncharacterized protein (DUF885 family)
LTMRTAFDLLMNVASFSASVLLVPAIAVASSAIQEATKLHALFEDEWQWGLREYPELATSVGDPRYNDRLTDLSVPAIDRRKAHERDLLRRVLEIDRSRLVGQDILSHDLFRRAAEQNVSLQRFPAGKVPLSGFMAPYEWMPISQMGGVHIDIPELPRIVPLRTTKDYDDFLARLASYPRYIDQVIELMKRGMASGWMPPAVTMRKVLPQIEKQFIDDVSKGPLYKPFAKFPHEVAEADRPRLEAQVRETISESIIPALKKLHQFIAETEPKDEPKDRHCGAISGLPRRGNGA